MKSINAVVFFVVALSFVAFPTAAQASCPNITGPYFLGSYYWYEYSFSTSCAGTSGSGVSTSALSCYSDPAYQFTGSSGTVTYSYVVGANDPIINSAHWEVSLFVDFNDPSSSPYNTLNASVSVTHNGSTTSHTIVSQNGTQGSLSCARYDYWFFSAVANDTITVTITGTNFNGGSTIIKAGTPLISNEN